MPLGKVNEKIWERAKKEASKSYPNLTENDKSFWRVVQTIYQNMIKSKMNIMDDDEDEAPNSIWNPDSGDDDGDGDDGDDKSGVYPSPEARKVVIVIPSGHIRPAAMPQSSEQTVCSECQGDNDVNEKNS